MKTPITDAAWRQMGAMTWSSTAQEMLKVARKLETDRAALMEALVECLAWTHRAVDLEVSGTMQLAQKGSVRRAESALSAARANFPDQP